MKSLLTSAGKVFGILLGCAVVAGAGLVMWAGDNVKKRHARVFDVAPDALEAYAGQVDLALGKRIVEVRSGCVECHGADLGGATVIDDSAMGRIDGPNITPHALGSWTDNEIGRAIRHGIGKDGHPLHLMPSRDFFGFSGGDLASVVAYLRTVTPVMKPAGTIALGPLGKVLIATGKIPEYFNAETLDHKADFTVKPPEMASVKFGRYLAQSCTGCHGADFGGGPIPGGSPDWAPASDLTPRGIGAWSEAEFASTMKSGVNPQGMRLRVPFPVTLTSKMSEMEVSALYMFFKTLPVPSDEGLAAKALKP